MRDEPLRRFGVTPVAGVPEPRFPARVLQPEREPVDLGLEPIGVLLEQRPLLGGGRVPAGQRGEVAPQVLDPQRGRARAAERIEERRVGSLSPLRRDAPRIVSHAWLRSS
ncbi:MAG TPA: hypothetical protein VGL47_30090 [Amycolatopsis sp.]|uniref:hypothetical protein n=1 Tax=Amycolatopsis sp. TaxID=37632 RepID=UPI002F40B460